MLSFRWLLLLVLCAPAAWADDESIDEVLQRSQAVIMEAEARAGEIIDEVKDVAPLQEADPSWLNGRQGLGPMHSPKGTAETETAQQRAWNQIIGEIEQPVSAPDQGPPHPEVPADVMYVYISLSMPEETIRSLFLQALDERELASIVFVIRGWDMPGPTKLISRLNALFPDRDLLRELPNVQVNPNLFTQQSIEVVPTFSTKDASGRWGSVIGSTSIVDAYERIQKSQYDGEVIGPTFKIEEPNLLELINERMAEVNWESHVERVKKSVLTKSTTGSVLPYATGSESYLVDLTIVNNNDLKGTTGEIFAASGESVNPFDYMTTQNHYVFFDANSPAQVEQALAWRKQYARTTMITTVPVPTVEGRKNLIKTLSQPVHEINDILIRRFRLRAVPSIAYQEGKMLRVDIAATTDIDSTAQRDIGSHE